MICHIEIPAPDVGKAKEFYERVFGWEVTPAAGIEGYWFWACRAEEGPRITGAFDPEAKPSKDGVNLVIEVADVAHALQHIEAAGGTCVKGRTEIGGDHGFYGLFLDPNGNRLGVWARS